MTRCLILTLLVWVFTACSQAEPTAAPAQEGLSLMPVVETDMDATKANLERLRRLTTAFEKSEISASDYLSYKAAYAQHQNTALAALSTVHLDVIYREYPELRRGLTRFVQRTYGPRYRASRPEDSPEHGVLASHLGRLMAVEGRDQETRNYLIRQGSIYLGLDGLDPEMRETVPKQILSVAFSETLKARPDITFDALLNVLQKGDPREASAAYTALSSTPNPGQAEQLLSWLLQSDGPLPVDGHHALIQGLLRNPVQQDRTWAWIKDNAALLLAANPTAGREALPPGISAGFCSVERRQDVKTLFADWARASAQAQDRLTETLASIDRCIQMKTLQTDGLRNAFGA
jgi:hypothetical protein